MCIKIYRSNKENERLRNSFGEGAISTGASSAVGPSASRREAEGGIKVVMVARSETGHATANKLKITYEIAPRMIATDVS